MAVKQILKAQRLQRRSGTIKSEQRCQSQATPSAEGTAVLTHTDASAGVRE